MARITAESLMAPGGLLDAGSRLTQTLMTVPFQREQFKAGLDEKALMTQREDQRIAKTDKIGYLKDRISTTQQRIAELRRALMLGDKNEAAVALKELQSGANGAKASKAVLDVAQRVGDYEAKLREETKTKLGAKFATAETENDIKDSVAKYEQEEVARAKRLGDWPQEADATMATLMASGSLKGLNLDAIKADPQLQTELDAALDQQSQLFDQYRQLVGQAQDVVDTRSFLQRTMPGEAPKPGTPQKPTLGPPGTNPQDYQNLPPAPPMVTMPGADTKTAYLTATQRLDDPSVVNQLAQSANPQQNDQLVQQQQDGAPQLGQQLTTLDQSIQQGQAAGMAPNEIQRLQTMQQQKQQAKTATIRNALSMAAFNQVTPETLAATDKILATVQPAGQELLWQELQGNASSNAMNANSSALGANGYTPPPDTYQGPRMTPHIVPRIQGLAPPGVVTPQQANQQRDIRSRLSAQGLYPR
jgi:hypothetical protein